MNTKKVENLNEEAIYELSHFAVLNWMEKSLNYIGQPLDRHRRSTLNKKMNEDHFLSLLTYKTLKHFRYQTDDRLFNQKMGSEIKNILKEFKEKG